MSSLVYGIFKLKVSMYNDLKQMKGLLHQEEEASFPFPVKTTSEKTLHENL